MKMLSKILVATDFSPAAADAVETAGAVAKVFHSQLLLVHVTPLAPGLPSGCLTEVQAAIQQRLEETATELSAAGVTVAKTILASGSVFDELIQIADAEDVNVVMVGSEQKTPDLPFLLGVTPARLIRKCDKPIWIVKPGQTPLPARILCAVDFSEPSRRALKNALHLARQFAAELTILHALDSALSPFAGHPSPAADALARQRQQREQELAAFLKEFDFAGVRSTTKMVNGAASFEILDAARGGADLLVMGSVGRTALPRILLGSVAEKVARELPCSIITFKSEGAIRVELDLTLHDLETRCQQGEALLARGGAEEALQQFERCLARDPLYLPAWEGAVAANDRLGRSARAGQCREKAALLQKRYEYKCIEDAPRAKHWLGRK